MTMAGSAMLNGGKHGAGVECRGRAVLTRLRKDGTRKPSSERSPVESRDLKRSGRFTLGACLDSCSP